MEDCLKAFVSSFAKLLLDVNPTNKSDDKKNLLNLQNECFHPINLFGFLFCIFVFKNML